MSSSSETLAIIPARGGSKGIPRKNVRLVAGKPLIGWNIEAALAAHSVHRVVVSTDDVEIGNVAKLFGAEVVRRPSAISGDRSSSEQALLHTLGQLRETEGYQPQRTVFLQCTSPLTEPQDIDGTVQALCKAEADTALAVCDFHYFLWQNNANGDAVGINHDKAVRLLRQQHQPQYLETGAVYVMETAGFLKTQHRFFGKTALYAMPRSRCLEIDDPGDLEVADVLIARRRQRTQVSSPLPQAIGAVVFDFDGVLTDNRVVVFQDGREAVICHRGDGWGLTTLKQQGIPLLVLSSEPNPVVSARCEKLGIDCLHGVRQKLTELHDWLEKHAIDARNVVYVGNDVNDVECLAAVGCGVAVSDAHPSAKAVAKIVLSQPGGYGAVRELADLLLSHLQSQGAHNAQHCCDRKPSHWSGAAHIRCG